MQVIEKNKGDIAIITLEGNMVGSCEADILHNEVRSLLDRNTSKIVLDMKDVHWMGSLCIGALMREIIIVRQNNGDVHLASLSEKVLRLFKITKLEGIVNIYPTVNDAVDGFIRH